jgi:protein phosphatase
MGEKSVSVPDAIEHASLTDVGVRRSHNQDCLAVAPAADAEQWQQHGHMFLVADGMGGHAVGEMASAISARSVPLTYQKHAHEGPVVALKKAFQEANASIYLRGQQNPEFRGMGTTTSALVLRPEGAWIGHVGDSRVYRIRGERIEQLSFDHSKAWDLARKQNIDPDKIEGVRTNILIRSMGPEAEVVPDIEGPHPVRAGDLFVLCSDGLCGPLTDYEIGAVASQLPPQEACQFLVDLANLRGGPDNITVIIVRAGAGSSAKLPSQLRKRKRLPWPLAVLVLGVVLAAGALALTYFKVAGGGVIFGLAVLAILAGIVGLVIHQRRQQQVPEEEPFQPRTRTYRQTSCKVDHELLDNLLKAEALLRQKAQEKEWPVDWDAHRTHLEAAERFRAKGKLADAFREGCRAVRPLTEALSRHRQKEEVFNPVWDKRKV